MKLYSKSTLLALIPLSLSLLPSVQACAPFNKRDVENAKRAAEAYAHANAHPEAFSSHQRRDHHRRMAAKRQDFIAGSASSSSSSSNNAAAPGSTPTSGAPVVGTSAGTTATTAVTTGTPAPVPTDPFAVIPLSQITSGALSAPTAPLPSTPTPGATPPVKGAPLLPSVTYQVADYPPANTVPPINSPQVTQWMKALNGIDPAILNIKPTVDGTCGGDPQAVSEAGPGQRCWWTCGGCTDPTSDIVTCPDKLTWGLSYDDGPSPNSEKVLHFLGEQKPNPITATFFIVGSRVLERPPILQAEYLAGHHISVHTWSHSVPLTALSNEQIVAELGWSRQIIQETIGVTPLTMRPPWGDIDKRVRAISLAMGLKPVIWTRDPTTLAQFDTNDWRVPAGQFTGQQSFESIQSLLVNATKLDTGFIVLQHDLWEQEVDLSVGYTLPAALSSPSGFKLMDINTCLHQANTEAYLETIQNKSGIPTFPGAGTSGVDVSGNGTTVGAGGTTGSTAQGKSGALSSLNAMGSVLSMVALMVIGGAAIL